MERKIGEIFKHGDEWYQCVESSGCALCAFNETDCNDIDTGSCEVNSRSDGKSVVFKRLEKVGEPFQRNRCMYQEYKAHTFPLLMNGDAKIPTLNGFAVIIKQNKEDMEEKNNAKHSNTENIGKNLKPFDLQAAKSGKPVCTRSGKPVRIICFDVKRATCPIIALVKEDGHEKVCSYIPDGRRFEKTEWPDDLMMIPEKKEGWVNLYRDEESKRVYCGEFIFSEREKAEKHYECNDTKVATVPVNWEE